MSIFKQVSFFLWINFNENRFIPTQMYLAFIKLIVFEFEIALKNGNDPPYKSVGNLASGSVSYSAHGSFKIKIPPPIFTFVTHRKLWKWTKIYLYIGKKFRFRVNDPLLRNKFVNNTYFLGLRYIFPWKISILRNDKAM